MPARKITLDALSPAQIAELQAQMKARENEAAVEKANAREAAKGLTADIVTLVTTSDVARQQFADKVLENGTTVPGAQGWSLGGSKFEGADGHTYRVSVLLRDEATIPPKER